MTNTFKDIEKLEADLWAAADNLRANSKLTSSDYFMPVLGVIFLRHAANRFAAATCQIEADQAAGRMPRRNLLPADYLRRRALWLPEAARYDWIMQQAATSGSDLPRLVTAAMSAIEAEFKPLDGVLPRDYGIFEPRVREDLGKCDFVMANPPFNVDLVDAEIIKSDPRLPFGLPGVNKDQKVSNGNYLWISYFWSYLNEPGRAGFVMSSQASSAGHGEKEVRKKIVETGAVDVVMSIRSNFFYSRTVPCELWFFDRAKPAERQDKVLMLDARKIYRKVTRKIYDFSPEHMKNLAAIVWLYRGQQHRFLALVRDYLGAVCTASTAIPATLTAFETTLADLRGRFSGLVKAVEKDGTVDAGQQKTLMEAATELADAEKPYETDRAALLVDLDSFRMQYTVVTDLPPGEEQGLWEINQALHAASRKFDPIAEALRGLIKQVDLLYKLTARVADLGSALAVAGSVVDVYDRRAAVEQLKHVAYLHRQVVWLQERFPRAELEAVPGLVRLVDKQEVEAADWSLTPCRYVGVAPPEEDENFDFEATLRDIHTELADLNKEAVELAEKIQANFEELGIGEVCTGAIPVFSSVIPAKAGIRGPTVRRQPAVYILASKRNGTLYIGVTSDLAKRVWQHKNDVVDGFTKRYSVHQLAWYELHETMESAIEREKALKNWKRIWKLELIENNNPSWQDLYETLV